MLIKTVALAGFTCFAFATASYAQEKFGEYDELVIKHHSDKDGKVTIEIKDGNVMVDGEKLDKFKDGDISVFRRHIQPLNGDNISSQRQFNFQYDQPLQDGPDVMIKPGKALLGVLTEKVEAAGATIREVSKDSPADKAGLKVGDIITKVDADKIAEPKDLFEKIGAHEPGDKVTITYLRDKKEKTATVTLDERKRIEGSLFGNRGGMGGFQMMPMPRGGFNFNYDGDEDDGPGRPRSFSYRGNNEVKLGLSVQDTENGEGAEVLAVTPGSAAEKAGFKEKDIITSVAGTTVASVRDMTTAYNQNKEKGTVDVQLKRGGKTQTIQVKVPKKLHKAEL